MKKPSLDEIKKGDKKESTESLISLIYFFAKDWMRPSSKHPLALQLLIFIIKLPALILFLALSPVIFLAMFITLVIGL
ncbi:hypothetical protein LB452_05855 [Psychroflexus sp. CAK8W]|uniref:Uncharacterized protein n=1 Tax=Psychroflexus longus TaxID=2873596 RepID=A0ABS7XJ59_9FLAO|nr:hypothetical protein [Psychroflexus longus]MBZ9778444.1 hypothetical protein [Psychroflexus longus]